MAEEPNLGTSQCPNCNCMQSQVLETRLAHVYGRLITVRRRRCRYCSKTFRTKEVVTKKIKLPPSSSRVDRSKVREIE